MAKRVIDGFVLEQAVVLCSECQVPFSTELLVESRKLNSSDVIEADLHRVFNDPELRSVLLSCCPVCKYCGWTSSFKPFHLKPELLRNEKRIEPSKKFALAVKWAREKNMHSLDVAFIALNGLWCAREAGEMDNLWLELAIFEHEKGVAASPVCPKDDGMTHLIMGELYRQHRDFDKALYEYGLAEQDQSVSKEILQHQIMMAKRGLSGITALPLKIARLYFEIEDLNTAGSPAQTDFQPNQADKKPVSGTQYQESVSPQAIEPSAAQSMQPQNPATQNAKEPVAKEEKANTEKTVAETENSESDASPLLAAISTLFSSQSSSSVLKSLSPDSMQETAATDLSSLSEELAKTAADTAALSTEASSKVASEKATDGAEEAPVFSPSEKPAWRPASKNPVKGIPAPVPQATGATAAAFAAAPAAEPIEDPAPAPQPVKVPTAKPAYNPSAHAPGIKPAAVLASQTASNNKQAGLVNNAVAAAVQAMPQSNANSILAGSGSNTLAAAPSTIAAAQDEELLSIPQPAKATPAFKRVATAEVIPPLAVADPESRNQSSRIASAARPLSSPVANQVQAPRVQERAPAASAAVESSTQIKSRASVITAEPSSTVSLSVTSIAKPKEQNTVAVSAASSPAANSSPHSESKASQSAPIAATTRKSRSKRQKTAREDHIFVRHPFIANRQSNENGWFNDYCDAELSAPAVSSNREEKLESRQSPSEQTYKAPEQEASYADAAANSDLPGLAIEDPTNGRRDYTDAITRVESYLSLSRRMYSRNWMKL
ncbi:MAG: hypothetical protein K2X27_26710 [Candidatus Obscuribacterales bacterium]|nr:hypothetical protein [Candidatus Obscuribacterales bacterium]